jgi:hypothetical protein
MTELVQTATPAACFRFFGKEKNCKFGDKCRYSHDEQVFMDEYEVHRCLDWDYCGKYCKKDYCRQCREEYYLSTTVPCNSSVLDGCVNRINPDYAPSGLCTPCFREMKTANRANTSRPAREARQCQGYNCYSTTTSKFCKDCYEANQRYVL